MITQSDIQTYLLELLEMENDALSVAKKMQGRSANLKKIRVNLLEKQKIIKKLVSLFKEVEL
jgi:hypothetical protein